MRDRIRADHAQCGAGTFRASEVHRLKPPDSHGAEQSCSSGIVCYVDRRTHHFPVISSENVAVRRGLMVDALDGPQIRFNNLTLFKVLAAE